MSITRYSRLAILLATATLASACSDSSTGPSEVQPTTLSQALADLQLTALAPVSAQLSTSPVPGFGAPDPASCSYDTTAKSFICPNVSVTGITVTRSFTVLDANGTPQSQFDQRTTAAVRMKTTFAGTVTTGNTSVAVDQQQEITLSGLLTGVHTLNGSSLGHVVGSVSGGRSTVPVSTTIGTTITNLVLPAAGSGVNRWPRSGTVVVTIANAFGVGGLPAMTSTASISFNGTSKAAVVVTTAGFTSRCTLDLSGQSAMTCAP
ncbi:MAG: hypothetical protein LH467_13850 [Gemmatimonadaceae bacterium]|nr:hypothetical protein [Gemmatimonadaceae bacterium]